MIAMPATSQGMRSNWTAVVLRRLVRCGVSGYGLGSRTSAAVVSQLINGTSVVRTARSIPIGAALLAGMVADAAEQALVLQTDFGLKDGAVAAMRGVAVGVSPRIAIHDLSHENTLFDIWEASVTNT